MASHSFLWSFDDYVLVEKFCLGNYKFSHGDVIVFRSPHNHKEKHVKRIIGSPVDWIGTHSSYDVVKVLDGHCWVEGDNPSSSMESRTYGPIPLGLVQGRITHIVWPPQRLGAVKRNIYADRLSSS
ncbi:mitochondrial inner membrane protease subunit 2-like isoform X2 [Mangifera indica]|uniref:mitochondrial inner membrane protease subunit 2-like isoform X2 n=1 Tax=Mangifera indica TaxID=29780 RepID=UPI001CF9874E|nr:mitochondrial inner membrane protease subunit 2-like isoform X2 [Mangifera indica]XP_044500503.1 mitochondrial inner membrane protease subunit 2-like isoform X2 [Mangifera indica]